MDIKKKLTGKEKSVYFKRNTNEYIFTIKVYACITCNYEHEKYYLSQGVDNESVIIYRKKVQQKKKCKLEHTTGYRSEHTSEHTPELFPESAYLEPVEIISNVTEEYLKEMDNVNNKFHNLL